MERTSLCSSLAMRLRAELSCVIRSLRSAERDVSFASSSLFARWRRTDFERRRTTSASASAARARIFSIPALCSFRIRSAILDTAAWTAASVSIWASATLLAPARTSSSPLRSSNSRSWTISSLIRTSSSRFRIFSSSALSASARCVSAELTAASSALTASRLSYSSIPVRLVSGWEGAVGWGFEVVGLARLRR